MGFSSGSWFQRCIVCHHDIGILKQFDVALGWVFSPKHDEKGLAATTITWFATLVGGDWNHGIFMTFQILGMSSSQLTNSYFSEG
jgi:hypothetical protein